MPDKPFVVVKVGGAALDRAELLDELARDVARIADCALVLVHGGSKDIKAELDRLDKPFRFVDGLRVTDAETMRAVEMVLSGLVNGRIVRALVGRGVRAVGLTGSDSGMIRAVELTARGESLGFVGKVERVDPEILRILTGQGITPVVSPVSLGPDGSAYNVNADQVAAAVAVALGARDLIFYSDVPGVSIGDRRLEHLSPNEAERHITDGKITGGMIPKVRSAGEALKDGVGRVHLTAWTGPGSLRREIDGETAGTVISREAE